MHKTFCRHSALSASLILGCVWSLWHLPASFIPQTYQAGLGIGTREFWLHFGGIVVLSVFLDLHQHQPQHSDHGGFSRHGQSGG